MDEGDAHEVVHRPVLMDGQVSLGQEQDQVAVRRRLLVDLGVTDARVSGFGLAVEGNGMFS